jgi:hypothetical protein
VYSSLCANVLRVSTFGIPLCMSVIVQQLYLGGEFVGGSDIVMEMYQTGELQEAIEVAAAS